MDDNNDKIAVVLWNSLMWNNCSSRYYWVIIKIVPDWKRRGKEGIWSLAKGVLIHASCNLVNSILSKTNQVIRWIVYDLTTNYALIFIIILIHFPSFIKAEWHYACASTFESWFYQINLHEYRQKLLLKHIIITTSSNR